MTVSDQEFDDIISQAMDELPKQYIEGLSNVLVTYEDNPTADQRAKLKLRGNETLFGLYEGLPLTVRPSATGMFSGNAMTLPDRITLFKIPLLRASSSRDQFKKQVKHTLWHEIAHYYGLDHDRIHAIERGEVT